VHIGDSIGKNIRSQKRKTRGKPNETEIFGNLTGGICDLETLHKGGIYRKII